MVFVVKSLRRRTAKYVFTPAARQPAQRMDMEIGTLLFYINAQFKEVQLKRFIIYFLLQKCK